MGGVGDSWERGSGSSSPPNLCRNQVAQRKIDPSPPSMDPDLTARCGGAAMSAAELAPPEGAGSAPLGSVPSALVPPSASRPAASTQVSASLTAPLLPTQPHPSSRLSSDPSIQAVVERRRIQVILSFFLFLRRCESADACAPVNAIAAGGAYLLA